MKEIISKDNKLIKYVSKLQSSAKFRREEQRFVSEGLRVCLEAVSSGAEITDVLITDEALSKHESALKPLLESNAKIYLTNKNTLSHACDTKTPQGVVCVLKTLDNNIDFDTINNKYVFLENIQDPSNLGTILRTADALGVSGVIMTRDCCDIYSPKVCRGAMGALFRVPFTFVDNAQKFISDFNNHGTSYAAVVRDADAVSKVSFQGSALVAIGNEGNGLTDATASACTQRITIPMNGVAESLNAAIAAGILMWEMIK
ncbi:MAG: RNA methyltransferase [Clostridia bacterium]|nr:RNA methyltransferase [Clostridia bacterium]